LNPLNIVAASLPKISNTLISTFPATGSAKVMLVTGLNGFG